MNQAPRIHILFACTILLAGLAGFTDPAKAQEPNPAAELVPAELVPAEDAETATNAMILLGPPQGVPLVGEALEKATLDVGSRLRCPVCQGLSVADSHTDTAIGMMNEARDLLVAGFTPEQSLLYFEQSYGEFIRLEPKAEGFNLVVWIVPVVALLLGFSVIALRLRTAAGSKSTAAAGQQEDPELAAFLEQVRRDVAARAKPGKDMPGKDMPDENAPDQKDAG